LEELLEKLDSSKYFVMISGVSDSTL
jgi:hypothetical protein